MSISSIASTSRGMGRRSGAISQRLVGHPRVRGVPRSHPPRGHVPESRHKVGPRGVPPISICVQDMDDRTLLTLAAIEDHSAREEILKRHIMDVDDVDYKKACQTFLIIAEHNIRGYYLVKIPYQIGMFSAVALGVASIPMVFHLPTVEWFNEWAVTMDHPPARDLDTPLEVSIWSWNWMELGTMSFVLLCMQYIRGQMINLGVKPYTGWIKAWRARKLANSFPQYDSKILVSYSQTANLMDYRKDLTIKDRSDEKAK